MLRSSDIVRLRVGDVCGSHLKPKTRLTVQQKKTGKPIAIQLNDYTRGALDAWIIQSGKSADDFLFTRRREPHGHRLSANQYRKLVKGWARGIDLDPAD
jgi:integrase